MVKYKMMVTNETMIPPLLLKRDESENPKVANRSGSCWEGGMKNSFFQIQLTGMMSKLAISMNFYTKTAEEGGIVILNKGIVTTTC